MKAAVVERPGTLVVREVPEPELGPYDALCRILYGATCTATDRHIIRGELPFGVEYPAILGHESIGRVIEAGPRVRSYRLGDLVTRVGHPGDRAAGLHAWWGGFAELGIARDHRAMLEDGVDPAQWSGSRVNQVLPEAFDPAASTMMITWRETLSYASRIGMPGAPGVCVVGSGANGLAFAAHARNAGVSPVVMVGSSRREERARTVGVTAYYDYRAPGAAADVAAAHGRFGLVIDAVGSLESLETASGLLEKDGTLGIYGIEDYSRLCLRPRSFVSSFRVYQGGYDEAESHEAVVDLVERGMLDAGVWLDLDSPYDLEHIGAAFEALAAGRGVKALVRIAP